MDLHRPQHLDDFEFQPSVSVLKQFIKQNVEIPNMILNGPEGSGKKSLLYAFLRDKYGIDSKYTKCISKTFKVNSKDVEIPYFYSNYHVEIQIGDLTNYTRTILPEIIKTIGSTKNILHSGCKILVLHQAEKLDSFTQNMLRRFFETYFKTCRFILITKYLNKIINPLQSRCLMIRVPALTTKQIQSLVPHVQHDYGRNMKMVWIRNHFNIPKEPIEVYIQNLLRGKKSNPRELIYSLLIKNYDFLQIIQSIYEILRKEIKNEETLRKVIEILALYSRRLCQGSRDVMHMEALLINLNIVL